MNILQRYKESVGKFQNAFSGEKTEGISAFEIMHILLIIILALFIIYIL